MTDWISPTRLASTAELAALQTSFFPTILFVATAMLIELGLSSCGGKYKLALAFQYTSSVTISPSTETGKQELGWDWLMAS